MYRSLLLMKKLKTSYKPCSIITGGVLLCKNGQGCLYVSRVYKVVLGPLRMLSLRRCVVGYDPPPPLPLQKNKKDMIY